MRYSTLLRTFLSGKNMEDDVNRFIEAQDGGEYEKALAEIVQGCKQSHWVWYIFPQMRGLGYSRMSRYYGIASEAEARAYLANRTLRKRLTEISRALLQHAGTPVEQILGGIDAQKVQSCMTLFDAVSPGDVFEQVLDTFYAGCRCELTLEMLDE